MCNQLPNAANIDGQDGDYICDYRSCPVADALLAEADLEKTCEEEDLVGCVDTELHMEELLGALIEGIVESCEEGNEEQGKSRDQCRSLLCNQLKNVGELEGEPGSFVCDYDTCPVSTTLLTRADEERGEGEEETQGWARGIEEEGIRACKELLDELLAEAMQKRRIKIKTISWNIEGILNRQAP